jgi:hypothetical protein
MRLLVVRRYTNYLNASISELFVFAGKLGCFGSATRGKILRIEINYNIFIAMKLVRRMMMMRRRRRGEERICNYCLFN